jgi:hypothetical protein
MRSRHSKITPTTLLTGIPLLTAGSYVVLYGMHQIFYARLGLGVDDVGLGRDALLSQALVGVVASAVLITAVFWLYYAAIVYGLTIWPLYVVRRLARLLMRTPGLHRWCPRPMRAFARRKDTKQDPERRRTLRVIALSYLIVTPISGAWMAYALAADVRDGWPTPAWAIPLLGIPIVDVEADPFRFTRQPGGEVAVASRDMECMLYLGRTERTLVFYDSRSRRPVRLPADDFSVRVGGRDTRLPARCRADPGSTNDDRFVAEGRRLGDLAAHGGWLAWSQRDRRGRLKLVIDGTDGTRSAAIPPSSAMLTTDLGPGEGDQTVAVYRRCEQGTCHLFRYDVKTSLEARLPAKEVAGCTTAWPAVWRDLVVFLRRGIHCPPRLRGLWTLRRHQERRIVPQIGWRARQLDLRHETVVWIDTDGIDMRVRTADLRSGRTSTLYQNRLVSKGAHIILASPSVERREFRWTVAAAFGTRDGWLMERDRRGRKCRYLSDQLPSNEVELHIHTDTEYGVDAVVRSRSVLYATQETLVRRPLDRLSTPATCDVRTPIR